MSDTMTFDDVDEALFEKIKTASTKAHGTVYYPDVGDKGTATTAIPVLGKVVLGFDLDAQSKSLTYTVLSKPGVVSLRDLRNGIDATIKACRQETSAS